MCILYFVGFLSHAGWCWALLCVATTTARESIHTLRIKDMPEAVSSEYCAHFDLPTRLPVYTMVGQLPAGGSNRLLESVRKAGRKRLLSICAPMVPAKPA